MAEGYRYLTGEVLDDEEYRLRANYDIENIDSRKENGKSKDINMHRTAYAELIDKCKSFYKEIRIDLLKNFLDKNQCKIEEIIVYGHSCAIDFDYFSYLNTRYPNAYWKFYVRGAEQESNVWYLIEENSIKNADIIKV